MILMVCVLPAFSTKDLGAKVDYVIPERIKDGYGINEHIIEKAAADGIHMILTCDNGIAAIDQIAEAKELGMTVVITDHHDIQVDEVSETEIMPSADAIVNPKRKDSKYPFSEICGAMVAYKLIQILYEKAGIDREEWLAMIEFAAIATVGDVMKLQDENRIVVKEGLRRAAQTKSVGLRKLVEKNNLDITALSAYHIGFVIGPCLNAGGRLQTAKLALRLLLCEDEQLADELAQELKDLNDQRKDMTADGLVQAAEQVEEKYMDDCPSTKRNRVAKGSPSSSFSSVLPLSPPRMPTARLSPPSFAITLLTLMPLPPGSVRISVIRLTVSSAIPGISTVLSSAGLSVTV